MDVVTEDIVWELKCVKEFQLVDFLQLIIYAWMWKREFQDSHGPRAFQLMNMRTGEIWKLDASSHYIKETVEILMSNKFKVRGTMSDAEFLEQCKKKSFALESDLPITNEELKDVDLAIFSKADLELICRGRGIKKISGKDKETLIGMIRTDMTGTKPTNVTLEAFGFGKAPSKI